MILSDFLFPAIATCAAYFAASQITSSRSARVTIALLLLFAGDLFSLGSLAVWNSSALNIFRFSQIIGSIGPNLVPPYETSFLSIYRTPEPQVSLSLMFVVLGFLAKFATQPQAAKAKPSLVVIAAISLLPLGYTFVTFPVALIVAACCLIFATYRMRAHAATIAIGLCGSLVVLVVASYWRHDGSQSTSAVATALSYHSRLPIITPAVLASVAFSALFGAWLIGERRWTPRTLLALACLMTPFVLSNQQILTGIMISARDWERNASYQMLVFGSALAIAAIAKPADWRPWRAATASVASVIILLIAVRGQFLTYRMWLPNNETSIAMVRALQAVDRKELPASRITLEDVGMAPLLQLRSSTTLDIPLSFYSAGIALVPNMAPDARTASPSQFEPAVFDHWRRTGTYPERARKILQTEIKNSAGTYISFLFSFRDSWYPSSDNRAIRQTELERSVDPLIERYRKYLSRAPRTESPPMLISAQPPNNGPLSEFVDNEYLGSGSAGQATVYLYQQRDR